MSSVNQGCTAPDVRARLHSLEPQTQQTLEHPEPKDKTAETLKPKPKKLKPVTPI